MRKLIVLFTLLSCVFANAQFVVNSYAYAPTTNYYPNSINPNPELILNDAAALDSSENVNSMSLTTNTAIGGDRTVETTNNGWTTYSRRITATSGGTLKRDRLRRDNVLTIGQIYSVDYIHRCNTTNNTVRQTINSTTGTYVNEHAAHTDWQLHSFEYTALTTSLQFEQYVRTTSLIGEWTEYNISVKLKAN